MRVHGLALGGVDLTSSMGRMTMSVIDAVAEFERDLLVERTHAGLVRAKEQDKVPGRPTKLTPEQKRVVRERFGQGATISTLAREFTVSRLTIQQVRDAAKVLDPELP